LVKPNCWRKLPHWVIWYGTAGTTPMIWIFLAAEIFYIFATEHTEVTEIFARKKHRSF